MTHFDTLAKKRISAVRNTSVVVRHTVTVDSIKKADSC
jgi:hypothetical protein